MARLMKRLEALESTTRDSEPMRWVRILQEEDQTEAEAIAAHEQEHGSLEGVGHFIIRFIVGPKHESDHALIVAA